MKENDHDCGSFRNKRKLYWTIASTARMTLTFVASWWQHCTVKDASSLPGRSQASIRCHITSPSPVTVLKPDKIWWQTHPGDLVTGLIYHSLSLLCVCHFSSWHTIMALESFTALGWTLTQGPKATKKWPTHAITLNQKQWNKYPYHGKCNKSLLQRWVRRLTSETRFGSYHLSLTRPS